MRSDTIILAMGYSRCELEMLVPTKCFDDNQIVTVSPVQGNDPLEFNGQKIALLN